MKNKIFSLSAVFGLLLLLSAYAQAATLTVNTLNDADDGACNAAHCSLREAIRYAAANDSIVFLSSLSGTITLTGNTLILKDVTITGNGARVLTVSGGGTKRVFDVQSGSVTISNLTISGGNAGAGFGGDVVVNGGVLSLQNSVITNGAAVRGGGIYVNSGASLTLGDTTVSGNAANAEGGGIFNAGTINAINTTVSGNSSNGSGGGISNTKTLNLSASTISNNRAGVSGGGINNSGIVGSIVQSQKNIIAGNTAGTSGADVFGSFVTLQYNLVGSGSGSSGFVNGVSFDIVGTSAAPVNALLAPLNYYGGQTPTHLLTCGSPALNVGGAALTLNDQRGAFRSVGNQTDIGAVEMQEVVTNLLNAGAGSLREGVTNPPPTANGVIDFSPCLSGTITLTTGEIPVNSSLVINGPGSNQITVSGNNASRVFSFAANTTSSILGLTVSNGFTRGSGGGILNAGNLTLTSVVLSNNQIKPNLTQPPIVDASGGGIANFGTLNVFDSTISGNVAAGDRNNNVGARGYGGGISSDGTLFVQNSIVSNNSSTQNPQGESRGGGILISGSATITGSTISGNVANFAEAAFGGGIHNIGTLVINDSAILNNRTGLAALGAASAGGGGINNNGTLTATNCTFSGNFSDGLGGGAIINFNIATLADITVSGNSGGSAGGIRSNSGIATNLRNSIIAGNSYPDIGTVVNSQGHNLIGNPGVTGGWLASDLLNVSNPRLAPLGNYGGATQTFALLPNSPALNAGDNANQTATDQRGANRIVGATVDIGAFENTLTINPATLPGGALDAGYNQTISASGGTAPYNFSILTGALPIGLSLNPTGGALTGTLTPSGSYNFTLKATDAAGFASARDYSFVVTCSATITISPTSLLNGETNQIYSQTFAATGGVAPYGFTVSVGALPSGLNLNQTSGVLGGTTTAAGSFAFTVRAQDVNGCAATKNYTLAVGPFTWTNGAGSDNWHDPNNWSPNGIPAAPNSATIPFAGSNFDLYPVISNADVTLANLTLSDAVLQVNAGRTLTVSGLTTIANSSRLGIAGIFNPSGGISGTGLTIFNGSSPQIAPAATYGQLEINNPAGVTLNGNASVAGNLNLTNGALNTSNFTLTLGAGFTRTNGYVNGSVLKQFVGAGSFTFPVGTSSGYSPVSAANNSGTGSLTVRAVQGAHSNAPNPTNNISRYWTLTGSGINVNLVFNYLQTDVQGTESSLRLFKINGTTAVQTAATIDTTANTASITGVTSFSDWTLSSLPPLAVNSLDDADDGACNAAHCSLREAVNAANSIAGDDTITFLPTLSGTILLQAALPNLATNITINGLGVNVLTVQRNAAAGNFRIFTVPNGPTVSINNLTISGGNPATNTGGGGNIRNDGILTIDNCIITNGSANGGGGGIANLSNGILTVQNTTIFGNSARGGGGIYDTSISSSNSIVTTIQNSSILGNSATSGSGGGISFSSSRTVANITNSTISGNSSSSLAQNSGGGIYIDSTGASLTCNFCTIAENTTNSSVGGAGGGVSIVVLGSSSSRPLFKNSIIANNQSSGATGKDISGQVDFGSTNNVIGNSAGGNFSAFGNKLNVNPRLAPLANYGGATPTYALLPDSPAINYSILLVSTDQRGVARPQIFGQPDSGAFELNVSISPATIPNALTGTAYSQQLSASGATSPYAFSIISGALPAGLTLLSNGLLTGNPTAPGTFTFIVKATDANGFAGVREYTATFSDVVWTGAVSTDWTNTANWSAGVVPTTSSSILIPASGVTFDPTFSIAETSKNVRVLTIETGRTLTIPLNKTLFMTRELHLNGGNILDSFALTFGVLAVTTQTGSGRIIITGGRVSKQFNAPGNFTFPIGTANGSSPATINLTDLGGNSSVTIDASIHQTPVATLDPNTSLHRYWNLTSQASGFTANLTFNYLDADVFGTESNYRLFKIESNGATTTYAHNPPDVVLDTTANTASIIGVTSFSAWTLAEPLAPTAASVLVGGRVLNAAGRGVFRAVITLTDANGEIRYAMTNPFGYYRFADVAAGATYIVSVRHKQFVFAPQVLNLTEELSELNFTAQPNP